MCLCSSAHTHVRVACARVSACVDLSRARVKARGPAPALLTHAHRHLQTPPPAATAPAPGRVCAARRQQRDARQQLRRAPHRRAGGVAGAGTNQRGACAEGPAAPKGDAGRGCGRVQGGRGCMEGPGCCRGALRSLLGPLPKAPGAASRRVAPAALLSPPPPNPPVSAAACCARSGGSSGMKGGGVGRAAAVLCQASAMPACALAGATRAS